MISLWVTASCYNMVLYAKDKSHQNIEVQKIQQFGGNDTRSRPNSVFNDVAIGGNCLVK